MRWTPVSRVVVSAIASISMLLFLAACGGGGGGGTPPKTMVEAATGTETEDTAETEDTDDEAGQDDQMAELEEDDTVLPPDPPVVEVPPAPAGFSVSTVIRTAGLWWDNPFVHYTNHAFTRIYRGTSSDFASATVIGTSTGISFTDTTVEPGTTYHYWIAWVSEDGTAGPAISESGMTSVDPETEIERLTAEILSDPLTWELTDVFWNTSARLGGDTLFSAFIYDDNSVSVLGSASGSNPVSGSAVWTGNVGAYDVRVGAADDSFGLARTPITGNARLEMDFGTATLDVDFTNFTQGHADMSWRDLGLTNGAFGDATIGGAFYGTGHEGVAGHFTRDQLRGAFGATRQ